MADLEDNEVYVSRETAAGLDVGVGDEHRGLPRQARRGARQ